MVGQLPARISAASPGACDAKWIEGSFGAVRMRPKRQKAQEPWGQSGPEAATGPGPCSRSWGKPAFLFGYFQRFSVQSTKFGGVLQPRAQNSGASCSPEHKFQRCRAAQQSGVPCRVPRFREPFASPCVWGHSRPVLSFPSLAEDKYFSI